MNTFIQLIKKKYFFIIIQYRYTIKYSQLILINWNRKRANSIELIVTELSIRNSYQADKNIFGIFRKYGSCIILN